jgi:hypothetical protein
MPSVAVGVHYPVSSPSAPTSGVRSSSRPVSSRPVSGHRASASGVRSSSFGVRCPPVRCPVSWCPPSARSHPSRPRTPGGGLGDHVGAVGNFTAGTDRLAGGLRCPERLGRRPESGWGRCCGGGGEAGGGAAVADLAGSGSVAGCDRARPLTGQEEASPTCGRPSLPAEPGMKARVQARCCTWAWLASSLGARPRSVVVVEPDRPGGRAWKGSRSSTGGWGAAPARPSQEVSETGSGSTTL